MKLLPKAIRIFTLLLIAGAATYGILRFFAKDEDDPYYYYGDSMYRGDDGEPIRYESDEEKAKREAGKQEDTVVPEGYSHMVN